jgi:hypothetical protein
MRTELAPRASRESVPAAPIPASPQSNPLGEPAVTVLGTSIVGTGWLEPPGSLGRMDSTGAAPAGVAMAAAARTVASAVLVLMVLVVILFLLGQA